MTKLTMYANQDVVQMLDFFMHKPPKKHKCVFCENNLIVTSFNQLHTKLNFEIIYSYLYLN